MDEWGVEAGEEQSVARERCRSFCYGGERCVEACCCWNKMGEQARVGCFAVVDIVVEGQASRSFAGYVWPVRVPYLERSVRLRFYICEYVVAILASGL